MPSPTIRLLKRLAHNSPSSSAYEMAFASYFARAVWLEQEEKKHRLSQRRRLLRERFAMNSIPDKEFIYKYRLSRVLFDKLCEELTPLLPAEEHRYGLDPSMKILAVLNFFAWGRLQRSTGKTFNLFGNQTMSRCIREVTMALNHSSILRKYIKFPENKNDRDVVKKQFFEKFGFPDVVGCIDCTHIAIIEPVTNEGSYFNNKDYFSFFAQIICDADCNIQDVNASFSGGSYHFDIWSASSISARLDALEDTAYILGSNNYILDDRLMIPIYNDDDDIKVNSPESRYNEIHKATYATIAQTIYKLKSRWRCLLACKELQYNHGMAARIFIACCVLHNMCNMAGLEAPEMSERDIEEERERQNDESSDSCPDYNTAERDKLVQRIEEIRLKSSSKTNAA